MGKTIFIVDDQEGIRLLLVDVFAQAGYTVRDASTGKEALDRLEIETFDLLIIDYNLPIVNGIDVIRTLEERGQSIPAILISGFAEQFKQTDHSPLIRHIIAKPFDIHLLQQRVKAILSQ